MGMYVEVQGQVKLKTLKDYDAFVEWLRWHGWINVDKPEPIPYWTDVLNENESEYSYNSFMRDKLLVVVPAMCGKNNFHRIIECFDERIKSYVDHSDSDIIEYDVDETCLRLFSEDGGINVAEFKNGEMEYLISDSNIDDIFRFVRENASNEDRTLFYSELKGYSRKERREFLQNALDEYIFGGTILETLREIIEVWQDEIS